jgi:type II secretory pathway pseudopilin PulG
MYHKIFTISIVVIALVAIIAGAITPHVIGQQNQTINLTALLAQDPNNDIASVATANMTASNDTTTNPATTTTTVANVDAPDNMTIEDAKNLYLSVWNQTEFNATFSTFVEPFSAAGYGVYEERNNIFAPGETIVLYVEPVGFGHEQVIDEGGDSNGNNNNNNNTTMLYLMNMTADYEIAAANGTELQLIEDVQAGNITSHRPNTEMFLTLTITPDVQPLPIGSYVITYSVNDEVSGESFQLEKDIIIAESER